MFAQAADVGEELLGAAGGVGTDQDRGAVTVSIRQLHQRGIEHADVVSGGVAAGVPASQTGGQELTGVVAEREHRVIAERLLERRRGLLLLAVTNHHRGFQIDHQARQDPPCGLRWREHLPGYLGALRPHHLTRSRPSPGDCVQLNAVELVQQPPACRIRRDRTEQLGLVGQHRDVGDRRGAISHRDRQIEQDPARIKPSPGPRSPGNASDNSAVSVLRSPTSASSREPACDTTPSPSAAAVIRGRVDIACTSKVLLYLDDSGPQQAQSPLVAGHFRLSSHEHANLLMKSRG